MTLGEIIWDVTPDSNEADPKTLQLSQRPGRGNEASLMMNLPRSLSCTCRFLLTHLVRKSTSYEASHTLFESGNAVKTFSTVASSSLPSSVPLCVYHRRHMRTLATNLFQIAPWYFHAGPIYHLNSSQWDEDKSYRQHSVSSPMIMSLPNPVGACEGIPGPCLCGL